MKNILFQKVVTSIFFSWYFQLLILDTKGKGAHRISICVQYDDYWICNPGLSISLKVIIFINNNSKSKSVPKHLLKAAFCQKNLEDFYFSQLSQKIPFYYPKLSYPVHGIDKIVIEFVIFQVKKTLWL